jgi:hypothetical protein
MRVLAHILGPGLKGVWRARCGRRGSFRRRWVRIRVRLEAPIVVVVAALRRFVIVRRAAERDHVKTTCSDSHNPLHIINATSTTNNVTRWPIDLVFISAPF